MGFSAGGARGVQMIKLLSRFIFTACGAALLVSCASSPPAAGDRTQVLVNYAQALRKHVRNYIAFDPAKAPDNPEVRYRVEQDPTGRIRKITKMQPSGNKEWDSAVERALWRSSPLPKPSDGRVEEVLRFSFRPHY
jgi:colicin import membrane protein